MSGHIPEVNSTKSSANARMSISVETEQNIDEVNKVPPKSLLEKIGEFATSKATQKFVAVGTLVSAVMVVFCFGIGPGLLFLGGLCLALYLRRLLLKS